MPGGKEESLHKLVYSHICRAGLMMVQAYKTLEGIKSQLSLVMSGGRGDVFQLLNMAISGQLFSTRFSQTTIHM